MKTKVDVIGGSGFIGSKLYASLSAKNNFDPMVIDKAQNQQQSAMFADVRRKQELVDTIRSNSVLIDLSAEHRDDVVPRNVYYETNVQGAINITAAARQKSVNEIIFISTSAVYGGGASSANEASKVCPFTDYAISKALAEEVYRAWQAEAPDERRLVIIRPTVVFGPGNRGNVYRIMKLIASRRFVMIGKGLNRKSLAYVGNVAAFIEHCLGGDPGVFLFNYVDKPDLTMNEFVDVVRGSMEIRRKRVARIPFFVAYAAAVAADVIGQLLGRRFDFTSHRVEKFCSETVFDTSAPNSGFVVPFELLPALKETVRTEFGRDIN